MRWNLLLCLFLVVPIGAHAQEPAYVPGDLLAMVVPGADARSIANDLEKVNGITTQLRVVREVSAPMRAWLFHYDGNVPHDMMLRALRDHRFVQMAQSNHLVQERALPDDAQYGDQWHHQNIDSEAAWDISTGGVTATGDTIVVCIIERSDLSQPDLAANAWFNHAEVDGNGVDDDGNGYTDDFKGWNTPAGDDEVYGSNHGTQVAGMIGAVGNNTIGVAGANWSVKMMPVAYGGVQEDQVVEAYTYPLIMRRRYNTSNGAEGAFVVATNASWGIDGGQPEDAPLWCAMYDTLGMAGILSCGATANNNVDVDVVGDLPTACASDYMVSVTATNIADDRTFSAYGLTTVDVGAPGASVYTTNQTGGYTPANGTSFASPLTAGVIGLLYSAPCASLMQLVHDDPAYAALYVRDKLFAGVEQVGNLPGTVVTGGRISAGNSMQLIMDACGPCPAPYDLSAVPVDLTTAQLTWSAAGGTIFDLRYRIVGAVDWNDVSSIDWQVFTLSALETCMAYEFQVRMHCDPDVSDYSASFTWTSEGCCSAPLFFNAGFIGEDIANLTWAEVIGAGAYDVRVRDVASIDWTMLPGITNTFTEVLGLVPCTNYEAQVASVCNGTTGEWSGSVFFTTLGCGACVENDYCASEGTNSLSEWIERVAFNNLDNTSGNDGGYGDHTGQSGDLFIGVPNDITLVPGYATFAYVEWWSVWVDLDQDAQFQTNELLFQSASGSSTTVIAAITPDPGALPGVTRMRVVMKYGGNAVDACTPFASGETEDHCVQLAYPIGMAEQVNAATVVVAPTLADAYVMLTSTRSLDATVTLTDAAGRNVQQAGFMGTRTELDVVALPAGLYTYRVMAGGAGIAQGRFVVVH